MKIGIKNFRILSDWEEFDLSPLTIFTGMNNSGKSTLQIIFRLFKESFYRDENNTYIIDDLFFEKIKNRIGSFSSNLPFKSKSDEITVYLIYHSNILRQEIKFELTYQKNTADNNGSLSEVNFSYQDNKEFKYIFKLSKEKRAWLITEADYDNLKNLFSPLKELGRKQQIIRNLLPKIKNNESLSEDEKKLLANLEAEGYVLNKKGNEKDGRGNPLDWDVWKNGKTDRFSYYAQKVYQAFSPIDDLIFNFHFHDQIKRINTLNELKDKKLKKILEDEQIIEKKEFLSFLQKFDEEIYTNYLRGLYTTAYMIFNHSYGDDISDPGDNYLYNKVNILTFFKEAIPISSSILDKDIFNVYSSNFFNLLDYIKETEKLSGGIKIYRDFLDPTNPDNKNLQSKDESKFTRSFLLLKDMFLWIWKEFTKKIDMMVSSTSIFLLDNQVDRHLLFAFDSSSRYNKILSEYAKHKFEKKLDKKQELFIKRWLKKFDFGTSLRLEKILVEKELIGVDYFLIKDNQKIPLADNGQGPRRLLLLILELAIRKEVASFLLEEPETSLHPAFQSKLADLFVDAHKKFGHTFIIETHSEYLIRKLQYLTAKKEIDPNITRIYYFHEPSRVPKGEKQIKEIKIEKDGSLSDQFGSGFFDEATNIKFELLKLKKSQNN